jgi:uncharacterized damage-inducible protein DinB
MTDIDRFLSLYQQQVTLSLNVLEGIPPALWTSIPADSETDYLGTRISRITIAALAAHLLQAEDYWISSLAEIDHGQLLPPPVGVPMLKPSEFGMPLIRQYRQALDTNIDRVCALAAEQLATKFNFISRTYTVQGFLWAVYAHHCYYFGQIDLLLRQQGHMPPEFLELPQQGRLIA